MDREDISNAAKQLAKIGAPKGGRARAEALTPEERSNISRYAAEVRWANTASARLPKATHSGDLKIGETLIRCHVLEDGRRLLSGRAVTQAMGLTGRGQGMARFLTSKSLKPFVSADLALAIEKPIVFTVSGGGISLTHGYEAWVLPELCNIVMDAHDEGALRPHQDTLVRQAKLLSRAFSRVGIVALVDEATGYQEVRDRNALHKILEAYIAEELLPWTKRFPDEFYKQLFRLRGWQYSSLSMKGSIKGPGYVGKLTNEIVYEKLPPGVLEELRTRNPIADAKGQRRYKHHQFLTENVGNPHLERHLAVVTALMRASSTWDKFRRLLARALPSSPQQAHLPGFETEEE